MRIRVDVLTREGGYDADSFHGWIMRAIEEKSGKKEMRNLGLVGGG